MVILVATNNSKLNPTALIIGFLFNMVMLDKERILIDEKRKLLSKLKLKQE